MTEQQQPIEIDNQGTIVLLRPTTDHARAWFEEHVEWEQEWCGSIVCEPRYAQDILLAYYGELHGEAK